MGYRNVKRCRFLAFPQTRILRFGGGPVLAAVGAKLQVVQAWCGCDGPLNTRVPGEYQQDGLHPENLAAVRDSESFHRGL